jgi:hypothetical protein
MKKITGISALQTSKVGLLHKYAHKQFKVARVGAGDVFQQFKKSGPVIHALLGWMIFLAVKKFTVKLFLGKFKFEINEFLDSLDAAISNCRKWEIQESIKTKLTKLTKLRSEVVMFFKDKEFTRTEESEGKLKEFKTTFSDIIRSIDQLNPSKPDKDENTEIIPFPKPNEIQKPDVPSGSSIRNVSIAAGFTAVGSIVFMAVYCCQKKIMDIYSRFANPPPILLVLPEVNNQGGVIAAQLAQEAAESAKRAFTAKVRKELKHIELNCDLRDWETLKNQKRIEYEAEINRIEAGGANVDIADMRLELNNFSWRLNELVALVDVMEDDLNQRVGPEALNSFRTQILMEGEFNMLYKKYTNSQISDKELTRMQALMRLSMKDDTRCLVPARSG